MRITWQDTITGRRVETERADNGDVIVYRDGAVIARLLPRTFRALYPGHRMTIDGWSLTETGGGCTALERTDAKGYWLITQREDASAPERDDEPVCLGRYDEDANCTELYYLASVSDALRVVSGELKGEPNHA